MHINALSFSCLPEKTRPAIHYPRIIEEVHMFFPYFVQTRVIPDVLDP